jgi:predicted MPP superfamily phosphohydrolase
MKAHRNKYYILNYVFIICVLILLFNDHYFKFIYSNWVTGKFSDIVGIIILPLLISYIFPRLQDLAILVSAITFIFWKSPLSQNLIDLYNDLSVLQTSRVVDYTDLFVLIFLPFPYYIIKKIDNLNWIKIHKANPVVILLPTFFSLMATSPPPSYYYTKTDGNLKCYKCNFIVGYNQDEIVEKLKKLDIVFDSIAPIDSIALKRVPDLKNENAHVYRLNSLVIDKDTLRNLDFTMRTVKKGKLKYTLTE